MLTPSQWLDFFEHVRATRGIQAMYRRTMDPLARREAERMEMELDAKIGWIAADLAAEAAMMNTAVEQFGEQNLTEIAEIAEKGGVS